MRQGFGTQTHQRETQSTEGQKLLLGRSWLWGMAGKFVQLGTKQQWGGEAPLRLSAADRRRHLYIIGQTGTGKSTLIKQIFAQDVCAGHGAAIIDPHGDLAHEICDLIPSQRVDDVIVLDPSDIERPPGLNPFYRVPADERALVAANLTATFKQVWRDSWGPRLEYILFNTIAALLDAPDKLRPSFMAIPLVLVKEEYRTKLTRTIQDPRVRSFFIDEFCAWPERQLAEAISPVQNKIGQFLSNPFIRNILGQWKPTIDLAHIMEQNKILITRLPKGNLGDEPANLFGSLLASGFQQAAMRRASLPASERRDFHLHIDEFHNFTTDAFASVLSEARKYGLTLTLGHQYLAQVSPQIREAIFGNVGSIISFRVSAGDADILAKEIGDYAPATLGSLGKGRICARLNVSDESIAPFLGQTDPYLAQTQGHHNNILHQSRMRFGRDRKSVENKLFKWLA